MKAKLVKENLVSGAEEFLILSLDASDEFEDGLGNDLAGEVMFSEGPMPESEASIKFKELKESISNVYLVKIVEKSEFI